MPTANNRIQIASVFTRYNCYESFTKPKLFFKLFFYTASGPEYLYIRILSEFEHLNKIYLFMNQAYHFKRIPGPCVSNVIFTMNNMQYSKMKIIITIHLSDFLKAISDMYFTFEYGFSSNEYIIEDLYGNFGINVQISNVEKSFIPNVVRDNDAAKFYFNSLKNNKGHLCVLTENNRDVIIQPYYGIFNPNGYIVGIQVMIQTLKKTILKFELGAFECIVDDDFINTPTAFITEEYQDSFLKFKALYVNLTLGKVQKILYSTFTPLGIYRYSFDISFIYPQNFKMIFLIPRNSKPLPCIKGYYITNPYEIKDNFEYYINKEAEYQVEPNVIRKRQYKYSPFVTCSK